MPLPVAANINLGDLFLRRAQLMPERRALTYQHNTQTFGALSERVRRLATALRKGGVCRGDRVGYIGYNHPSFLEGLFASACLGAIFVPINFRLSGSEIRYIANDAGVHTLLVDDERQAVIQSEQENLCCRRYLTVESRADGWESLEDQFENNEPVEGSEEVQAHDVAVIMYTSGTTGFPKGVMLTHSNLFWNIINSYFAEDVIGRVSLTCAPMFHIGGLNVTTLQALTKGVEVILHQQFEPQQVLQDIARYKVSSMFGVPTMFLMMSQHADFDQTDLSSLQILICGGAAVPIPLIKLYSERGIPFNQGYGLTETAPFSSFLTSDMTMKKVGSAGTAPMFTSLHIVDRNGESLAAGEVGEICVSGPNVMKGYWNRPDATAQTIDDKGWFHSGDIGYLDEDGYLFLCDRLKDMVISGGENIYPAEIESVLYGHPDIIEIAVIGLPHEKWGEAVTAIAVIKEGAALTLDQLRDFAELNLARYKLPSHLHLVDSLPRNPAGKVLKYQLKEQFGG